MKQFLITLAGVLAGLILFVIVAPIVIVAMISSSLGEAPATPRAAVLEVDLRLPMTDQRPMSPFAAFGGALSLMDTLSKLDAARTDTHIKGVLVRANTDGMSGAQAEEIRAALARLKADGKFVIAHIQNGGVRQSMAGYMAIAGADEVWLQKASEFHPMGLAAEQPFFGATLARFRVTAEVEAREEYKSALDQFTRSAFSPADREGTLAMMQSLYQAMSRAIAEDRGLTPAALEAAIQATPMTGEAARAAKLVDQFGQPEDAQRAALERAGEGAELLDIAAYRPTPRTGGPVIAIVHGEGAIVPGPEEPNPFSDSGVMTSDVVAKALLDAAADEDVRAIVFRVSSPGGSVVASDQILSALRAARAAGKRVVVSMGEVAASGGYYVSADADEIVASSTTITGSIGVIGGKFVIGPALDYLADVRSDRIVVGSPLVLMFSAERGFTPTERAAFAGYVDRAYQDFVTLVAEGRDLTVAQAREVARGRVWTGEQAKARGLVDHLGGLYVAIDRAKALAEIEPDARVQLRTYPAARSPFDQLQTMFGASADAAETLALLGALAREPAVAEALRMAREDGAFVRAEARVPQVR